MSHFKIEREPIHPGEILKFEFLDEMGLTQQQLSKDINVTYAAINEITNGKRGLSIEMAYKLAKYFNTSVNFWINLQSNYEIEKFEQDKEKMSKIEKIKSYS